MKLGIGNDIKESVQKHALQMRLVREFQLSIFKQKNAVGNFLNNTPSVP